MKSVIDIDVLGSYNTVKATLPYLIESASKHRTNGHTQPASGTGGRIIFVSATLHYSGTPLQAHVSVAKAGVDAMAVSVAIEQVSARTGLCNSKLFSIELVLSKCQGPKGITSNIIAPGPIADTEGVARLSKQESREKSSRGIPSGRYGAVKEIADATIYLFSDAGNYVNGETLVGKSCSALSKRPVHTLTKFYSRWRPMAYGRFCERILLSRLPAVWRCCDRRCWWEEVKAVDSSYYIVSREG
jgi:peroxisomal 2,4-dienoyl-CoA reductase